MYTKNRSLRNSNQALPINYRLASISGTPSTSLPPVIRKQRCQVIRDDDDDDDDYGEDVFDISHQTTVEILSRRRQTSDVIVRTTTTSRSHPIAPTTSGPRTTYCNSIGPRRTISVLPTWKPSMTQSRVLPPIKQHDVTSNILDAVAAKMPASTMLTGGQNISEYMSDDDDRGLVSLVSNVSPVTAVSITMSNKSSPHGMLYAAPVDRQSMTRGRTTKPSYSKSHQSQQPLQATAVTAASRDAGGGDETRSKHGRFSVAEWNRQKVLHLRRASLRRTCLVGPQSLNWVKTTTANETREGKDSRRRRTTLRQKESTFISSSMKPRFETIAELRQPANSQMPSTMLDKQRKQPARHNVVTLTDNNSITDRQQQEMFGSKRRPDVRHEKADCYSKRHTVEFQQPTTTHQKRAAIKDSETSDGLNHPYVHLHHHPQQTHDAYDSGLDSDVVNPPTSSDMILAGLEKVTSVLQQQQQQQQQHMKQSVMNDTDNVEISKHLVKLDSELDDPRRLPADEQLPVKTDSAAISDDLKRREMMMVQRLTRKASLQAEDRRGSYYRYELAKNCSRRTTLTDSKSSTPATMERQDYVTDYSRPVSSMSSSIAVDEITSLPGSPFYRQVLQRRSSSIDSSIMSRPGSDFLDVPILLVQARDRSPSLVDLTETSSEGESPTVSPVGPSNDDTHSSSDLQQQVVHRISDVTQLPPVTPCHSPDGAIEPTANKRYAVLDVPAVQAPQVSLTTEDGDDFDVWFGRRGSIFIEEKGTQRPLTLQQTTRNALGQVSLAVPKPSKN